MAADDFKPTPFDIHIHRGVTWPGFDVVCYNDIPPPNGPGIIVDISGWLPHAQIRKTAKASSPMLADLLPFVFDGPNGVVRFPLITDENTLLLTEVNGVWNLVMETPAGDRQAPIVQGVATIDTNITRNEP